MGSEEFYDEFVEQRASVGEIDPPAQGINDMDKQVVEATDHQMDDNEELVEAMAANSPAEQWLEGFFVFVFELPFVVLLLFN